MQRCCPRHLVSIRAEINSCGYLISNIVVRTFYTERFMHRFHAAVVQTLQFSYNNLTHFNGLKLPHRDFLLFKPLCCNSTARQ